MGLFEGIPSGAQVELMLRGSPVQIQGLFDGYDPATGVARLVIRRKSYLRVAEDAVAFVAVVDENAGLTPRLVG